MSIVRSFFLNILAVLLLGLPVSAHAVDSLWPPQDTIQSRLIDREQMYQCSHRPPDGYTGHLLLDSKYDQDDASKSSLTKISPATMQIRDYITSYHSGLLKIIGYYEKARTKSDVNQSLACLDEWLDTWAHSDALLSREVTSTGRAARKWSLAAISSGILKVQALSNELYTPSSISMKWISKLTNQVIEDYTPRQNLTYAWFNNHDYWAAWAVASSGMLLQRDDYLGWANKTLRLAIKQLEPSHNGRYLHFPLESARGRLATDYTHYALVPLSFLVQGMSVNRMPLTEVEKMRFSQYADFAVHAYLYPDSLAELDSGQVQPAAHKLIWILPFLQQQADNLMVRQLYIKKREEIGYFNQMGGNLRSLYSEQNWLGD